MKDSLLKVDSVRVCYGESEVIQSLSLAVASREIVAVMGLNGMGKTTLMKALIGLLSVSSGSIVVDGQDLTTAPPFARVSSGLAYVPQGRLLFSTLTVEENIQTGLPASEKTIPTELYDLFPVLRDMRNRRAGNLSGGQQQQVAIARALASRPKVLLLDEPTEGLQPSIIKEMAVQLRRIRDERGLAIVVSEQVLTFALAVADRLVVMVRGGVVHESRCADLSEEAVARFLAI